MKRTGRRSFSAGAASPEARAQDGASAPRSCWRSTQPAAAHLVGALVDADCHDTGVLSGGLGHAQSGELAIVKHEAGRLLPSRKIASQSPAAMIEAVNEALNVAVTEAITQVGPVEIRNWQHET